MDPTPNPFTTQPVAPTPEPPTSSSSEYVVLVVIIGLLIVGAIVTWMLTRNDVIVEPAQVVPTMPPPIEQTIIDPIDSQYMGTVDQSANSSYVRAIAALDWNLCPAEAGHDNCIYEIAVKLREVEPCDEDEFYLMDNCRTNKLFTLAIRNNNAKLCGRIDNGCVTNVATTNKDLGACDTLNSDYLIDECKTTAQENIASNLALMTVDKKPCETIKKTDVKLQCVNNVQAQIARNEKDPAKCPVTDQFLVDNCIVNVVYASENATQCAGIKDIGTKGQCLDIPKTAKAMRDLKPEDCRVPTLFMQDLCVKNIAISKHDATICSMTTSQFEKDDCIKLVG